MLDTIIRILSDSMPDSNIFGVFLPQMCSVHEKGLANGWEKHPSSVAFGIEGHISVFARS